MNNLSNGFLGMLAEDIKKAESLLENAKSDEELTDLHRELDAKYQACFDNWGDGMYGYIPNVGFHYEMISEKHNISMMLGKMKALLAQRATFTKNSGIDSNSSGSDSIYTNASEIVKKDSIFISHRSTDKDIVKILYTFLRLCGVSADQVFISSLPGNDIKENIPVEVKTAIETSCVQIALLSKEYYESAYCLNEAGIMWYRASDAKTVVIAMPDIDEGGMLGFLNSDYKIKRLDQRDDLFTIIDIIKTGCKNISEVNSTTLNKNVEQLITEYKALLENREKTIAPITPDRHGCYTVKIEDIFDDPEKPHRFYLIKGFLKLDEDTSYDESHWICDWNKKNSFKKGDTVVFQVKDTTFEKFIMHGNEPLYNFRNITPERDIRKI